MDRFRRIMTTLDAAIFATGACYALATGHEVFALVFLIVAVFQL